MAATVNNLKDFFALAGFTITNAHLQRLSDWLTAAQGFETPPTPDDFIKWLHGALKQRVLAHERDLLEEAIVDPTW
jgi:hypothetical protein